MLDYTVMDTHDKELLVRIATMVEENQRRLDRIIAEMPFDVSRPDRGVARRLEKEEAIAALSANDRALFDDLRDWRRGVASEAARSPMTVCHDQALLNLVALRPGTDAALRATNPNLAAKHGADLLAIIKRHPADDGGDW